MTSFEHELVVAGKFLTAGSVPASSIARWNGAQWSPLGQGINDYGYSLLATPGRLYVAGSFHAAGGIPAFRIASWDGVTWSARPVGIGTNPNISPVTMFRYQSDLYVGGSFSSNGNGGAFENIGRWQEAAPPLLSRQPKHQSVSLGASMAFSVRTEGLGPQQFRWHRGDIPLFDGVSESGSTIFGAATAQLNIEGVRESDFGEYRCQVSNQCGAVLSEPGLAAIACVGDMNADLLVDDADFVVFLAAYNILDCADLEMPTTCPADFNRDSFVDDSDFVIFLLAYNQLLCP